ncbi:hypothetical protein BGX34_008042 [Mortierella sp. NVP85]|nr:hypothetical protein BGX34_008042 [Mortierella sp. NVP85]
MTSAMVSILINVPSITSPWVGTARYNEKTQDWDDINILPIPHWLDILIILSLVMSVICNICVLLRFLERYTWHAVILSLVTATVQVVAFCILFPPHSGVLYLEGFWTMIASMVFSLTATVLMSIDLHRTPHFRLLGSGVTHKQRILIAEAMALCLYLAIGALVFIYLERWTFLDALFFVMVTITTIGFGDHAPVTTGGRIFVIFYAAGGIVLLALVVNSIRYVILEDLHGKLAARAKERKAKRHAKRQEQKASTRNEANQQRLQGAQEDTVTGAGRPTFTHLPRQFSLLHGNHLRLPTIYIRGGPERRAADGSDKRSAEHSHSRPDDECKTETIEILRKTPTRESADGHVQNVHQQDMVLTGAGSALDQQSRTDDEPLHFTTAGSYQTQNLDNTPSWWKRLLTFMHRPTPIARHPLTQEEQRKAEREEAEMENMREYQIRLLSSAMMFTVFWLVGAVVFTFVESWSFGSSVYFVVVAFTSIGYGDLVPRTIAGRAIFLSYCLLGVVTLTSLASLIAEVLSKSMRRHVVETHLRRVEQLEAFEEERNLNGGNGRDLEQAEQQVLGNEGGQQSERTQVLSNLVAAGSEDHTASPVSSSCQGSLQNLVKISKDLDRALQQMLGLDDLLNEESRTTTLPLATSAAIVDYLEKEEGDSTTYLSPSLSRDITSTSSIHRHSVRSIAQVHKSFMDTRSSTFHGLGGGAVDDESQINITAWPTRRATIVTPQPSRPDRGQGFLATSSLQRSATPTSLSVHQRGRNGTNIAPVQLQHFAQYVKQFKALTVACEEALQKVAAWEASEKRLRERRNQVRRCQKRLLQERLRQLEIHEAPHGAVGQDDDEEEELEELEDWEEEGSIDDEEDEALDQRRSRIAASLLGPSSMVRHHNKGRGRQLIPRDDQSPHH